MSSFIRFCAQTLYDKHGDSLRDCTLLFPNRRSILYFRKALVDIAQKPVWAPEMHTLDGWIKNHVKLGSLDELSLIIRLYDCWRSIEPEGRFEAFYTLGQVLIKDFNAIDEAMIHRDKFFRDLASIPSLSLDELSEFDTALSELAHAIKKSEISTPLSTIWSNFGKLYNLFSAKLLNDGLGTPGIIYRTMAESDISALTANINQTYAIGFYKLNIAERRIISSFPDINYFWSLPDPESEQKLDWSHPLTQFIVENSSRSTFYKSTKAEKPVKIFGASGQQMQLQAVATLLSDCSEEQAEKTSIVLPEQGLLLPLLQVVPNNIAALNVSMGLSVMDTGIYALVQRFINTQSAWKNDRYLRIEPILLLLEHPLFIKEKLVFPKDLLDKNGPLYWHWDSVKDRFPVIWRELFSPAKDQKAILEKCLQFLNHVYPLISDEIDKAGAYHLYLRLQRLETIISEVSDDWSPGFFSNLLRRILQHSRITLQGEPLKGLQILGSQELANLDFDHLILIDTNEGVVPIASHQTCVPHSLARMYKLPGIAENIELQEYLFWASFENSGKVSVFYNTSGDGMGSAEPSRWIRRLFMKMHPEHWKISMGSVVSTSAIRANKPIIITKNEKVISLIKNWLENGRISPSAINNWLGCKLRFYLNYILKFREEEEKSEDLDSSRFGTILHDVMQKLYQSAGDVTIDQIIFEDIKARVDTLLIEQYTSEMRIPKHMLKHGSHAVFSEAIILAIKRVLRLDEAVLPFKISDLEADLKGSLTMDEFTLNFYGKADRIDVIDNRIRIVDYKTGTKKQNIFRAKYDNIWNIDGTGDKEALQTLFYAWLFKKNYPDSPIPEIHLYFSRGQNPGEETMVSIDENKLISNELLLKFEADLLTEISSMISPSELIDQTTNLQQCSYCSFKQMCGR